MSTTPEDIAIDNSTLTNYVDIPSSEYPTLEDVSVSEFIVNHLTKPIINNTLADSTNIFFTWFYPINDNLKIRMSVGYQFQIIEGTFSSLNMQNVAPPSAIKYEKIVNLKYETDPANRYINLSKKINGRIDLPSNILEAGKKYTARIRTLLFSELGAGAVQNKYFKYSSWSIFSFKINSIPYSSNFRVNDIVNPSSLSFSDSINFSFTFNNNNGPDYFYGVQVGTTSGQSFSANIWDSGIIYGGLSVGTKDFTIKYSGPKLSPSVTYVWRVNVKDSLLDGGWSPATNTFKYNSALSIKSLKISGKEILFGETETVSAIGQILSWEYIGPEGSSQRAYNLIVRPTKSVDGATALVDTGDVYSSITSFPLPDMIDGAEYEVLLKLRDATEFGNTISTKFNASKKPETIDLRIDGKQNPGDVSTTTPFISWRLGSFDSQEKYRIQVSTNETFDSLLWDTGDVSSTSNSVIYSGSPLSHGSYYYIRLRVSNYFSDSDWKTSFFAINTRPNSPTLIHPSSGEYSGIINITWNPASPLDEDGDEITYTIEITDRRSSNSGWDFLAGPFDSTTTSYSLDTNNIKSGSDYGIRVLANDGFCDSDPALGTSPVGDSGLGFKIPNHAPETPKFVLPDGTEELSMYMNVEWIEGNPPDIDGDSVFYILEITSTANAPVPTWTKIRVYQEGLHSDIIDISNYSDGNDYALRILAVDAFGATSNYAISNVFSIVNSPSVTDFEKNGDSLFISTNDGRILKANEAIWEFNENFSQEKIQLFKVFSNDSSVTFVNQQLKIYSPVGSSYILRITE